MLIKDVTVLKKIIPPVQAYNLHLFKPIAGFSLDSRTVKKGEAFIALKGRYRDGHDFIGEAVKRGVSLVISERGYVMNLAAAFFVVDDTKLALKKIAAHIRKVKNPFVYGITGSVGKTTTKEMLAFLLERHFKVLKNHGTENNLFGVSKTVFSLKDEEVMLLELGTNSPGEIKALAQLAYPDAGIVTCIKPVHLEGLRSLKGIYEEKISLLKANHNIKAILNRDDYYLRKVTFCKEFLWFGRSKRCDVNARFLRRDLKHSVFLIQDSLKLILPVWQENFIINALAAITGARLLGLEIKESVERLNYFKNFLRGRMERKQIDNLTIINDAYNSSPYAFKEALNMVRNLPGRKIAVIGDMRELGRRSVYYHRLLAHNVIKGNFDYCLTMGDFTPYLRESLIKLGYRKVFHFDSHDEISRFIKDKVNFRRPPRKETDRYLLFLKGSRKMELEKIISALK